MSQVDSALQRSGFERIAIVGLGLIGGSIALATRKAHPAVTLVGVDTAAVLKEARERGALDIASEQLAIVAGADLVILAAPVRQNVALIGEVSRHVTGATLVTDVGSTKRAIIETAASLKGLLTFVGGHPIAGAASRGLGAARADLFSGRPWVFTPDRETPQDAVARLSAFVSALGAKPHVTSAAEHDRVLAFTSHLPQLTVSTLMRVAGGKAGDSGLALAGPALLDTTRVADSPFGIWEDICLTNADNIRAALDGLIRELALLRSHVADPQTLRRVFEEAQMWRARARLSVRHGLVQPDSTTREE